MNIYSAPVRCVVLLVLATACASLAGCGSKEAETPAASAPATAATPAATPGTPAPTAGGPTGVQGQITKDQQSAVQLENSDGGKAPQ